MEKAIHNLGKEARLHIIYILLQNRGKKELSQELGITPAAITKYLKGKTHPSDNIIRKCLDIATEEEYELIINIIISDLTNAIIELIENVDAKFIVKNENVRKLKKIIDETQTKLLSTSSSLI
ncbi:helix-turn-helix domain-containing protein [Saccharolobus caldissimus]|uniref:HTH cro/C1-type domain-containing protein n=1 Tax=Saccharolobus caldissimus TaxID=1702097 RepID=A0AAQ4CMI7_9CREN|nr:helix-turn-helix transcriptional regulator [Saccharolobus caldissimus]BDB97018.1 hypothetical protein SACC_00350 [Saccharolobus caldissimus]